MRDFQISSGLEMEAVQACMRLTLSRHPAGKPRNREASTFPPSAETGADTSGLKLLNGFCKLLSLILNVEELHGNNPLAGIKLTRKVRVARDTVILHPKVDS